MTIGTKIIGLFLTGGLVPFIAIGFISYYTASTSLKEQAMNQLISVREMKKAELTKYFVNRTADIKNLASSTMTLNALEAFKAAFKEIDSEKLRKLYIFDNPYPAGKKLELIDAQNGSTYTMFHAKYHPLFKYYLENCKYFYDIFLVDSETGDIVYTTFKEDDFATNLYTGKYSHTNIGELARAVHASRENTIRRVDFQFYAPSHGDPARFMACPILDEERKRVGILIFQFSIEPIDAIMTERAGLGETGEAYLVGPDKLMRSNSRFLKESTVLKQKVDTIAVQEALNNQTGTKVIKDYRGVPVLSAYSPLKVGEMTWAIIVEIDEAEAGDAAILLMNHSIVIGVIIAVSIVMSGLLFARGITEPVRILSEGAKRIIDGDLSQKISVITADEIGAFTATFNKMVGSLERAKVRHERDVEILKETQFTAMVRLAMLAEKRDPETGEHLERMKGYSRLLTEGLRRTEKYKEIIDDEFIETLVQSSPLHDIGKVAIPDNILLKNGRFTKGEFEIMKQHALRGAEILRGPEFLKMSYEIAISHHEKYDGSGYPYGLSGDAIPLFARIIALADVYDALTSKRVYKEVVSHEEACLIILSESGKSLDPDIVQVFKENMGKFAEVKESLQPVLV